MEERYELQERFDEIGSTGEISIFCHFTDASGAEILESGLYVGNKEWYKSFLKLDESEIDDICAFIDDNRKKIIKAPTMIVVAVYKDLEKSFIRKSEGNDSVYSNWSGVGLPDYIVDSEFILGYVDVDTLEFFINSRSMVAEDLMIL